MSELRVRAYDVRFGDAVLVTVPDRGPDRKITERNILIDVGSVLSGTGRDDSLFVPILEDVHRTLNGKPLDLYVMTHEHLDHVKGLYYASENGFKDLKKHLNVQYAWLTASADPSYYKSFPGAEKKRKLCIDAIASAMSWSKSRTMAAFAPLLANNDTRDTSKCVDFLRGLARRKPSYVYRGTKSAKHPFKEAKLSIWAPEQDCSSYYGRFLPLIGPADHASTGSVALASPIVPPAGVDAGAFLDLVRRRESGTFETLLQIDRAANNTSIVFSLEWCGWRLLFAGDAEHRSWKHMAKEKVLKPVHFLKVSHHGSSNGTPEGAHFDAILPRKSRKAPDGRPRFAIISSAHDTYSGIPHDETNRRLEERCTLLRTTHMNPGETYVECTFSRTA